MHGTGVCLNVLSIILYLRFEFHTDGIKTVLFCYVMSCCLVDRY